jgi:hypothetical protein
MSTVLSIGVVCDRRDIYNEAINYFKGGIGAGNIEQAIYYMHPGYMGQGQEMGRDQGHAALNVALIGAFCQMAYNQGDDLFAYQNNRVLAMCEYFAKFNLGEDVPYLPFKNCSFDLQTNLGGSSRGNNRPCWDLIYNHYVHIKGLAAPWSEQYAARNRPDGGGSNYGGGGGYDQLGFTTLTCFLDPIAAGNPPSGLTAILNGPQQVQLNWWGTAYATSYYVKRATTSGGPYTTIATITTNLLTYTDSSVASGVTYYYTISALTPSGESVNGNEAVVSVQPQLLAFYKFNESSGITATDASGNGRTATLVGATWTAAGHSNNAVNLNGANQYVTLPNTITITPAQLGTTTQHWIGRSQWTPDPYLNGRVDDFRIYNGALSAAQIAALVAGYRRSRPRRPTSLPRWFRRIKLISPGRQQRARPTTS